MNPKNAKKIKVLIFVLLGLLVATGIALAVRLLYLHNNPPSTTDTAVVSSNVIYTQSAGEAVPHEQ